MAHSRSSRTKAQESKDTYTLELTFHSASNLPIADIHGLSSDPYILAYLYPLRSAVASETTLSKAKEANARAQKEDQSSFLSSFRRRKAHHSIILSSSQNVQSDGLKPQLTQMIRNNSRKHRNRKRPEKATASIDTDSSASSSDDEGPPIVLRTPTIRQTTDPKFGFSWVVANIPAQGCRLVIKLRDEDDRRADDALAKLQIIMPSINSKDWTDIKEKSFQLRRSPYNLLNTIVCLFRRASTIESTRERLSQKAFLNLSLEMIGKTSDTAGRQGPFTLGPTWATKHVSPLLGLLANTKEDAPEGKGKSSKRKAKKPQRYKSVFNSLDGVETPFAHRYQKLSSEPDSATRSCSGGAVSSICRLPTVDYCCVHSSRHTRVLILQSSAPSARQNIQLQQTDGVEHF